MEKVDKINLPHFRNNEHFQFMMDVNKLILFCQASQLGISSLYPSFRDALNAENTALRVESGSSESGDVLGVRILIDPIYEQMVELISASMVMEMAKPVAIDFVHELNEKIKYYKTIQVTRVNPGKDVETPAVNN